MRSIKCRRGLDFVTGIGAEVHRPTVAIVGHGRKEHGDGMAIDDRVS
jgi:hypothetical protein